MAEDKIKDCAELDARLAPFVDGEVTPDERRAVRAHLSDCPPCRQHADDEGSARDYVRTHRDELRVSAPASLRTRCALMGAQVPASTSQLPAARMAGWRKWAPLSVAATLVLAVAGVFLFGLNNPVQALASTLALDHIKCQKLSDGGKDVDALAAGMNWEHDRGWTLSV